MKQKKLILTLLISAALLLAVLPAFFSAAPIAKAAEALDTSRISRTPTTFIYNGSVQHPTVTVKNAAGQTLTAGTDYTVTYPAGSTEPGTYLLRVDGKGNYSGTVKKAYKITAPLDASKVTRTPVSFVYDGTAHTPTVTVKDSNDNVLTAGVDYKVTVESSSHATVSAIAVASYFVKVDGMGLYSGTVRKAFTIKAQALDAAKVTCSSTTLPYTGSVQQPTVTVKNAAGQTLTKGTDYTVSYSAESSAPGSYTLTVTGKGNYSGSVKKDYTISGGKIEASRVTRTPVTLVYDMTAQRPAVTVKDANDNLLTEGVDYRVVVEDSGLNIVTGNVLVPGSYYVRVTGIGGFTGSVRKAFTVKAQTISADNVILSSVNLAYTGSVQQPSVTVKDSAGRALLKDTDYTLSYASQSVSPGSYSLTVTGKGNYTGTVTASYSIAGGKLDAAKVTRTPTSFVYDGTAHIPAVTVKDTADNTLTEGVDYTVAVENTSYQAVSAVAPATYYVKVTAIGAFTGTVRKAFTVKAQPLQESKITCSATSFTYNGQVQKPTVTVKNAQGTTLTANTDYTVSYSSGSKNAGSYSVTVTGKGNYSGTVTKAYTIKAQALATANITRTPTSFTYDGSAHAPAVTVKDTAGNVLTENTDYTITVENPSYNAVSAIAPGSYFVKVTGRGNFSSVVRKAFSVKAQSLTDATVICSPGSFSYNGETQQPTVIVTDAQGNTLTAGTDYTVTYPAASTQPGDYTVSVTGKGNYSGTATQGYAIHDLVATEAVAATCLAAGNNKYYTCGTCGKVFADAAAANETTVAAQTLAKLPHSYTGNVLNNLNGTHSFKCVNGCEQFSEPIACNKFAFVETPATCTEKARTEKKCTECGMTLETVVDEDSVPVGHSPSVYTPPTCTEAGFDETNCTNEFTIISRSDDDPAENYEALMVCGYMEKTYRTAPEEQALGHQLNDNNWTTEIAATCLAGGTETNVCTRPGCGETITRDTEALGHNIEGVSPEVTAATCSAEGLRIYRCQRCQEPGKTEIIPVTHDFSDRNKIIVTLNAGCEYDGYKITECKNNCTIATADLAVNDLVKLNATTLQCSDGTTFSTNTKIKAVYGIITAVGGDGTFTVNFAPIGHPETEGVYAASAFTAPATKRVITAAKGHTAASTTIQARTCTQDGIIEYSGHCNNCNKDIPTTQVTIKATGHIAVEGVSPTCTEGVPCANTQYGQHNAIAPLGHDYVVPGCVLSNNAVNGFYCTRCGQMPAANADKLTKFMGVANLLKSQGYATKNVAAVGKTRMVTSYSKFDFGIYTSAVKSIYESNISPVAVAYEPLEVGSIFSLFPIIYRNYAVKSGLTMDDLDSIKIERIAGLNTDTLVSGFDETPEKGSAPDLSAYKGKNIDENIIKVTLDMKDEYYAKTGSNIPVESRIEYGQRVFIQDTHVSKVFDYDIRKIVDDAGYDAATWTISEPGEEINMEMRLNWITDSAKLTYYFAADDYAPIAMVCSISEGMDQDLTMQVLSVNGEIKPIINTERTFVYLFSDYFNGLS